MTNDASAERGTVEERLIGSEHCRFPIANCRFPEMSDELQFVDRNRSQRKELNGPPQQRTTN
jgi:hypothetical protein